MKGPVFPGDFPKVRMRRLRSDAATRDLVSECRLTAKDLIYPIFVSERGQPREAIASLPGIERIPLQDLGDEAKDIARLGILAVALFPVVGPQHKTEQAKEAYNPQGLIQQAIPIIKEACPHLVVVTDVALDPFTSHGQDGLLDAEGKILNDETTQVLVKQAVSHVEAGADVVAPSDMMDGRIGVIREAFEEQGYKDAKILSYAAKYASSFYGPFRDAVGSKAALGKADKRAYQMDPANSKEALKEVSLDLQEGADMVMVKPGLPYLDVVHAVKEQFAVPTFVYHVSGEYAMIKAACAQGWLDEKSAVLEALLCCKRAGADAIVTYYAKQVAEWL